MVDALLSGIRCDAVKLDELNLSSCSLPASALHHLSPVVAASSSTLQRLDLQGNEWNLSTSKELRDWEEFLMSFRKCVNMRRVDFSQNYLGDKGVETLVRVYTREIQDPSHSEDGTEDFSDEALSRSVSAVSVKSDVNDQDEEDEALDMDQSMELGSSPTSSLAASALIKSNRRILDDSLVTPTRGLRSIAYIYIRDVGMTDLSALHLSFLLPYHQLPHVLLRRLDAGIPDPTIGREDDLYAPDSLCRGVMYDIDNPDLSTLGRKILESVEKVRRAGGLQPQFSSNFPTMTMSMVFGSAPPSPDSYRPRRNSDSSRTYFPETPSPSRKESIASIRTTLSHGRSGSVICVSPKADITSPLAEVYKARPKIQGEILKITGTVHVCQLWSAAIKLLSLARILTLPQAVKTPTATTPGRRSKRRPTKVYLPPSPISPGPLSKIKKSHCVGGLDPRLWAKILWPLVDTERVLSERQAISVVEWAADKGSLAREHEWAGKLQHVQMWKLLDVSPLDIRVKLIEGSRFFEL
jgi:hypothetical protein